MNRAILLFSAAILLWLAMAAPLFAFTVNGDRTVFDPATGLMWDRCAWGQTGAICDGDLASTHTWQAALGIAVVANTENHRGYNDWRLPNRTELESLVDIMSSSPAIDGTAFPDTPPDLFWSSTVFTPNPANAWFVSFNVGGTFAFNQTNDLRVRLVRSGQSFDALAPAALGMITQPSSAAQSGIPFPQQPIVEVQDTNGDAVLVAGTDITAAIASGGGTLTGTTTVATDADGRATFTDLAISGSVGDRTLSFSADPLTSATSGTITLSAGPAAQMAINAGNNQSAVAGGAVATEPNVIVRDANGNPVSGVAVTFAVASGGGSVTGGSATTNASGIATVGSWTLGTAVGENTLTATSDGLTGSPLLFTATAQNAPPTAPVITAPTPGATVLIEGLLSDVLVPTWTPSTDINGDPVSYRWELAGDAQFSTILLSVPTGSDTQVTLTFEAIEQLLLANGVSPGVPITLFHRAIASDGTVEVEGSGAEVTLRLGTLLGPADQMSINAGDGQSATGGTAVAVAPSVLVTDARANPVSGVAVTFAIASGGGSVTGASATTNASGIATVGSWTLGATAGTNTLTATSGTLTGSPVTFTATGTAGTATQMAINAGNNQSAVAGTDVATAPSVIVSDANGNPVEGVSVTFAVVSGGGTITGASATTNASGIATVGGWTLGDMAGTNTLTASAADLPDVTFTATGTAGTAAQMAINAGNNQSAVAGTDVATAPSVIVRDDNDNPVEGVSVTFAVATGGASVTGASATTNASGIATVGGWTLGATAGTNTLTATAPGLSGSPVTFTATGTAGAATQMAINAGDNQSATAGAAVATAPSVIVRDANGNPVSGVEVNFAVAPGGGSVSGGTAQTNASGIATVGSWTLGTTAGTNTLTASATGLPDVTFTATGTVGTATQMAINAGDGQSAVAGEAVAVAPSVLVTDANDNPVSGVTVTFAVASGGGSVTGGTAQTNASGIATVGGWTLGTSVGPNTLTATATGLTGSPVTFNASAENAPPTVPVITAPSAGANIDIEGLITDVFVPSWTPSTDINDDPLTYTWQLAADTEFLTVLLSVSTDSNTQLTLLYPAIEQLLLANGVTMGDSITLFHRAMANDGTVVVEGPASEVTLTLGKVAGPASQMTINAGDGQSAVAGEAVAVAPSVLVTDANDNPVEGVSVTFAVASGDGTIDPTTPVATDANGIATVNSWTLGTTAGTNTLIASAAGLPDVTFSATGTTGTATQMAINAGDGQSATGGTAVAVAPSVRVTDANDNPVEGVSVTFAVASGDGTIDPTTPVATDANGIATVNSWTLGTTASTNMLTASAAGVPDVTFSASATTAPTAPTDVTATPGNAEVTVTWTAPTDTGGSAITGYTVTGDPDGSCSVAGDVTECTITGLTNGTEYFFEVVATNAEGESQPSNASESVTPTGPPGGPSQVQVEPTTQGLMVSWVAPSDNGGTPIISYRAEANPSCEVPALADEVPGETAYSCTISGLDPERDYAVTVIAINAAGESTAVAAAAARPLPVIPVPTLGTWALFGLMLLMLAMAMPVLLRRH